MRLAEAVAAAVADMREVRRAFARAGLLDPQPAGLPGFAGGGAGAERLRRDLLLADAWLRNRVARTAGGPLQIVVFGGTKVGKSSVVNMLAQAPLAAVSPEGGYTRFPWAFAAAGVDPLAALPRAFPGFARVAAAEAPDGGFDQYCVVTRTGAALPADIVLWDTPDCDSVGAERHLAGLIEALSLADLVVYVTSVEKYAVAALVDWVFELHGAGVNMLECLNKTPPRDRAAVLRKQAADIFPRIAREHGVAPPDLPVVALRFMAAGEEADLWDAALHPEAETLRASVLRGVAAADAAAARRAAAGDAARRIAGVLAVARRDLAARAVWQEAVSAALAAFVRRYEVEYLASGEVIEPFTRLNLEIMRLLDYDNRELNAALQFVRRWTTLPSRIVIHVGRRILTAFADPAAPADATALAPQARAFANAHADLLNALGRLIDKERAGATPPPFWTQLGTAWEAALPDLHADFADRIAVQLQATTTEIHAAAESIVAELRKRPALLGALKGVRIATQAGAVAVGFLVPHGGLVHDALEELVITPLLLGATEKSADFLVGAFVERRRRELVERLKQDAARLADTVYRTPLDALAAAAKTFDLDRAVLERLPERLRAVAAALDGAAS